MKRSAIVGGVAGVALAGWLLSSYGLGRILALVADAGWLGLAAIVLFHVAQILPSALGWRAVTGEVPRVPGLGRFILLRWIREGVNNLLPVAQVGGEVVAARLLRRRYGMALAEAIAGTVADLTLEMLTQIAFTLLGLGLLVRSVTDTGAVVGIAAGGIGVASLVAGAVLGAQLFGFGGLVERGLGWLGDRLGWEGAKGVQGLQAALSACWRAHRRVAIGAGWQMLSWLLGGIEVCLAMHLLGHDVGIVPGLVIESLGQALKAAGFAVPGAVGVQEAGYVVVGRLFGLSPELSLALSLVKRLREVVLGIPALLVWQRLEWRSAGRPLGART